MKAVKEWGDLRDSRWTSGLTSLGLVAGAWGLCALQLAFNPRGSLLTLLPSIPMLILARAQESRKEKVEIKLGIYDKYSMDAFERWVAAHFQGGEPEQPVNIPLGDDLGSQAAREILEFLGDTNVRAKFVESAVGPTFIRVKLKLGKGVKVNRVKRLGEDLKQSLAYSESPIISVVPGGVAFDVPRRERQIARFLDYIDPSVAPAGLSVAVGVDINNQLLEWDLSDPNTCHLLVGATTGGGKSVFLKSLILSLIVRYLPSFVQLILIDPKRVEFSAFKDSEYLWRMTDGEVCPVIKEVDYAIAVLELLADEMERRYKLMEALDKNNLDSYNEVAPRPLPHLVCVFDEVVDFTSGRKLSDPLIQTLVRLAGKARAAGIHLVFCTQRPEQNAIHPLIRANLPARVGLRVGTEAESEIVFGTKNVGAENLLGYGDLIARWGGKLDRFQALYADIQEVLRAVKEPALNGVIPRDSLGKAELKTEFSAWMNRMLESGNLAKESSELTPDEAKIIQACLEFEDEVVSIRDLTRKKNCKFKKDEFLVIFQSLQDKGYGEPVTNERGALFFRVFRGASDGE